MSTITRAVEILNLFGADTPALGLSEIHRRMRRDKATCHRHLTSLVDVGMLEQDAVSRKYRIGPAVMRWAALRKAAVPRKSTVLSSLATLAHATGELAHASVLDGTALLALASHEPARHGTRVVIDVPELPLNATASGLAVLAFARPGLLAQVADGFAVFTETTLQAGPALNTTLAQIRATGFGLSDQGFEAGVYGLSAPVFDTSGYAAGAVSVACVSSRMTPALQATIKRHLIAAARHISGQWGGCVPPPLDKIWTGFLAHDAALRPQTKETV